MSERRPIRSVDLSAGFTFLGEVGPSIVAGALLASGVIVMAIDAMGSDPFACRVAKGSTFNASWPSPERRNSFAVVF